MKVTIWPSLDLISSRTALSRSSNSPRYFAPATIAARSRETRRLPRNDSGTSPATIRWARPSTTAVLPTPGSPIRTGLFLVRRHSTWTTRRISRRGRSPGRAGPRGRPRSGRRRTSRAPGRSPRGRDWSPLRRRGRRATPPPGRSWRPRPRSAPSRRRRRRVARPISRCSVETYSSPSSAREPPRRRPGRSAWHGRAGAC